MAVLLRTVQGRQRGYEVVTGPDGRRVEQETFTCGHCSQIVTVPNRAAADEVGGFCRVCMSMVCPGCLATDRCDPYERKLERIEARERLLRSVLG